MSLHQKRKGQANDKYATTIKCTNRKETVQCTCGVCEYMTDL